MANINKLIERAEDAHKKRNYDYAITVFLEAVSFAPNNRRAREGLRNAELKKWEKSYPSAAAVAIFGLGARLGMFVAGLGKKGNPEAYMMACERFLKMDPKNRKVNMALGAAAAAAGHLEAAIFAYETAAEHHPSDVAALKSLGHLLAQNGEIQRAHRTFDKVVSLNAQDQEAIKMRKNLAAEASLKETGFETAKSSRELVKDKEATGRLEQADRMYQTEDDLDAQRDSLQRRIESEPENTELMKNLAEVFERLKDYDGAIAVYEKALKVRPGDQTLTFALGDVKMTKIEQAMYALKSAGDEAELARKEQEFLDLQTEEFRARVQAYPTDMKLRFKLGNLLLRKDLLDDAIAQFQQTVRDPKFRAESRLRLGRAFADKGQFELAIRQLEQALEGQAGANERVKEIWYALGDVHDRQGSAEQARDWFGKIYEVDISFRDVGDRLHKLASSGGEGTLSLSD